MLMILLYFDDYLLFCLYSLNGSVVYSLLSVLCEYVPYI